ncbi:F-box protein [Histoplasma capsulatum H143]|uniref:F-box protein n=1 Tax=Ajellomyces capsulatus (strain H143) TaxID=544712 RepID=C6HMZ3_AJECH|nr:F-box protein [Histoplasma capsulatum H143]
MASRVLSSTQPVASIETLPNELLDQVLSYLSPGPPPSSRKLRQVPAHSITSSTALDLKNVSRASPRFRALTRPLLFAHTRHELRDQDRFLDFLREHELAPYVQSVVVSVRSIYPGSEKPLWWVRLLGEVDPRHLTVIAPPYMFAHMALCHLDGVHSWAFELPLQTIQFHRPAQRSVPLPNHGSDDTLFSARPWTEILFNEGSSLRAYSNYEYYLLRVPSIMDHWGSVDPLQSKELPYPVAAISRLTSIPLYRRFPFLQPHELWVLNPNSTIFEDEQRAGTLDPNDPWMELDTSYSLISHSVRYLGVQGKLVEFRCFDFELGALRDNLVSRIGSNLKGKWAHQGDGLWLKL